MLDHILFLVFFLFFVSILFRIRMECDVTYYMVLSQDSHITLWSQSQDHVI